MSRPSSPRVVAKTTVPEESKVKESRLPEPFFVDTKHGHLFVTPYHRNMEMLPEKVRSVAVFGDTKDFVSVWQNLKGRFNRGLLSHSMDGVPLEDGTREPGWIFGFDSYEDVKQTLQDIADEKIQPDPKDNSPKSYPKNNRPVRRTPQSAQHGSPRNAPRGKSPVRRPISVPKGTKSVTPITTQVLTYTVVKPRSGMSVMVEMNDVKISGSIVEVQDDDRGFTTTAFMKTSDTESPENYQLGVLNGKWQVVGMLDDHSVSFSR